MEQVEYELIDISFEADFEVPEENAPWSVGEEDIVDSPAIEYDADGIPMGGSMVEIKMREKIIAEYLKRWRAVNCDGKVYNKLLNDYIFFRNVSFAEACEHSAKSYKSTRAVLILEEVMKNATPIKRVPVKPGDKNQKDFEYLLVMLYKHADLGSIKLTVGIKKRSHRNIQYGISAMKPDETLIDYSQFKRKKKRSPQK